MEVLRIATAGSVDDGKSTLIGRLLYETNSITTDKLEGIKRASQRKGIGFLDLSLLTDGLIAEREQGITIDVAHIYFNTAKRKFIIADSPGHVEYTRNMITGASKAEVSIILVDVRNGILDQTHRHYYIANLLRIPNVIVCINKMDLVGYDESLFESLKEKFLTFAEKIRFSEQEIQFVPVSARYGENISKPSSKMNWYKGKPLLAILEGMEVHKKLNQAPARFPVQYIIRPRNKEFHDFRGYAGRVASGSFKKGDAVTVLPSLQKSQIANVYQYDKQLKEAKAQQSVVITLDDNIDISRGDFLVKCGEVPELKKDFECEVCWMNAQPLLRNNIYLLCHGASQTKVKISSIDYVLIPSTLEKIQASELKMNDIACIKVKSVKALSIDRYSENPSDGVFILVDEYSNNTLAVGFVK
ncbi:MAG: GTP-binding protein [Bacteroidota bacterium]